MQGMIRVLCRWEVTENQQFSPHGACLRHAQRGGVAPCRVAGGQGHSRSVQAGNLQRAQGGKLSAAACLPLEALTCTHSLTPPMVAWLVIACSSPSCTSTIKTGRTRWTWRRMQQTGDASLKRRQPRHSHAARMTFCCCCPVHVGDAVRELCHMAAPHTQAPLLCARGAAVSAVHASDVRR